MLTYKTVKAIYKTVKTRCWQESDGGAKNDPELRCFYSSYTSILGDM